MIIISIFKIIYELINHFIKVYLFFLYINLKSYIFNQH